MYVVFVTLEILRICISVWLL